MPMTPEQEAQFYHDQRIHDEAEVAGGQSSPELSKIYGKMDPTKLADLATQSPSSSAAVNQLRRSTYQGDVNRMAGGGSSKVPKNDVSYRNPEPGWERALVGVHPADRDLVEHPQEWGERVMNDPAFLAATTLMGFGGAGAEFAATKGASALPGLKLPTALGRGISSRIDEAAMDAYRPLFEAIQKKTGPVAERIQQVANEMGMPVKQVAQQLSKGMRDFASHITGRAHDFADEVSETLQAGKQTTRAGYRAAKQELQAGRSVRRAAKQAGGKITQDVGPTKPQVTGPKPPAKNTAPSYASKPQVTGPKPPAKAKPSESAQTPHETKTATPKPARTRTPRKSKAEGRADAIQNARNNASGESPPTGVKPNAQAWRDAGKKAPPSGISKEAWAGKSRRERYNLIRGKSNG